MSKSKERTAAEFAGKVAAVPEVKPHPRRVALSAETARRLHILAVLRGIKPSELAETVLGAYVRQWRLPKAGGCPPSGEATGDEGGTASAAENAAA